jgi:predicted metalloprotease with PDZ domain
VTAAPLQYHVELDDPRAHHFAVTLTVPDAADGLCVSLPVWIPGSYLVREFARHLSALRAEQDGQPVPVEQLDKARWRVRSGRPGPLTLRWRVYAFDRSVRAAFLDGERGFFNGTSLFLRVEGQEARPHAVSLGPLPEGWEVAPALRPAPGATHHFDELVDHPVELGRFWRGRFEAGGVPHEFVVTGAWPGFDGERLLADAQAICAAQIAFWGGSPCERYVFLLNAVDDGYGGLEHRASTALICGRKDLPRKGQTGSPSEGYATLLGLVSHEYFHTWNVKRLKPAEFARLDYRQENYTRLLWFFEGFTSYYDDLFLVRAGLIDEARYLQLLGKAINGVLAAPGRKVQSLADASFDAWVKYYRQDENTPNATVSYYTKGSLVALALDLALRRTGGTLDAVMHDLWQRSGGGPIHEADIHDAVRRAGRADGAAIARQLAQWVQGTDDLPLVELLAVAGVQARAEPQAGLAAALGLKLSEGPVTGIQVRQVLAGGAGEAAGIAAGDELLAADGWRLRRLDEAQQWRLDGQPLRLLLARDQRLHEVGVTPPPAPTQWSLSAAAAPADDPAAALRRAWLGR